MSNATNTVLAAIVYAAEHSADYFNSCLATRSTGRVGSWYEGHTPSTLLSALEGADWEEYSHQDVKAPAIAYRAALPGKLGMVSLDTLPADAEIVLLDPKGGEEYWTGERSVGASVSASRYALTAPTVEHTVMLIGPASRDEGAPLTVWTFHPGDPCRPSECPRIAPDGADRHGKTVTVAEAIALGFDMAKLTE